jgi:hypothetical protein
VAATGDRHDELICQSHYRQRITHFTEELDFLSDDDTDWILGRAILARLGWT